MRSRSAAIADLARSVAGAVVRKPQRDEAPDLTPGSWVAWNPSLRSADQTAPFSKQLARVAPKAVILVLMRIGRRVQLALSQALSARMTEVSFCRSGTRLTSDAMHGFVEGAGTANI